jgi:hypothetical protein
MMTSNHSFLESELDYGCGCACVCVERRRKGGKTGRGIWGFI